MSKHTPGPWIMDADQLARIRAEGRKLVATVNLAEPLSEGVANAYLVLAAPKLLAQCKAAVEEASKAVNPTSRLPNFSEMCAAIAEAEGHA